MCNSKLHTQDKVSKSRDEFMSYCISNEPDMENLLIMTDRIMNRLKRQLMPENQKHQLTKL